MGDPFLTSGAGLGGTIQGGVNLLIGASDQALKWTQFAVEGRKSEASATSPSIDALPKLDVVNTNLEKIYKAQLEVWTALQEDGGESDEEDDDQPKPARPQQIVATGFEPVGSDRLVLGCKPLRSKDNKLQITIDWDYATIKLRNTTTNVTTTFGRFIQGMRMTTAYTHTRDKGIRFQIKGDDSKVSWAEDHCVVHLKLSLTGTNARSTHPWMRDFAYSIKPRLDGGSGAIITSTFGGGERTDTATAPADDKRGHYTDEGAKARVRSGNVGVMSGLEEGVTYNVRCFVAKLKGAPGPDTNVEYPVIVGDHSTDVRDYYKRVADDNRGTLVMAKLRYKSMSVLHPKGQWLVDFNGAGPAHQARIRDEILALKKEMDSSKHVEFH